MNLFERGNDRINDEIQYGLCRLASRHPHALVNEARQRQLTVSNLLGQLADFAGYEQRRLGRHTNPVRLIEECIGWHEEGLGRRSVEWDPDARLPSQGLPRWNIEEDDSLAPIETVGDVIVLGRRMKNCLAVRVDAVMEGNVLLASGELEGETVAVEVAIERNDGQLRCVLIEARAARNQELSVGQSRRLADWVVFVNDTLRIPEDELSN